MPKVSIIAPAYNAENFIQRYIDSVLAFEHKDIQLILVNDASKDKTHDIIESNRERIENAGIEFDYINLEENKGQANALNVALKHVTGEYLSWQDVDDIFYPNCLSRCLEVLKQNPECKIVFSKALIVDENRNYDKEQPKYIPEKEFVHKDLLKDYIIGKNVIWGPLKFVETKALFDVLQDKSIYISTGGQNAQLLFPMVYKYKCIYIDEILSEYIVIKSSHSHCVSARRYRKARFKTFINTIYRINMPFYQKAYYILLVLCEFTVLLFK